MTAASNVPDMTFKVITVPSQVFFLFGGKEGNASCTITPCGVVCGTPGGSPLGLSARWTTFRPSYPLKPPYAGAARPHPVRIRR
jgi:hypothetical protein